MDQIPLDRDALERLAKILGYLGSTHDSERAVAAQKAHEFIRRHGLQWSDILIAYTQPEPHWRQKALVCFRNMAALNQTERKFVKSMLTWRGLPSEKQLRWLTRLYENLP